MNSPKKKYMQSPFRAIPEEPFQNRAKNLSIIKKTPENNNL